jgi:transcriptional regulator with XRE-family HTH domain
MNPESIYRHIGGVIRARRKTFKPRWTQEKLAKHIGISRASLANIETGRQSVLVHQLYVFAEALDLSPSDFLLTVNDAGARAEWGELIPDNLKPIQKEQIARWLADAQAEPSNEKREESHAKQSKR